MEQHLGIPRIICQDLNLGGSIQGISFPGDLSGMAMRQSFLERGEMVG